MTEETKKVPSLDEQLLEACRNGAKVGDVKALLDKGANASYEFYDPGVWGARQRRGPIHMAIKSVGYKMEENKIAEVIKVVQLLLESGAKPNSLYEDYNWKGGGESTTAFQMALPLAMKAPPLLSLFLVNGADPNLPLRSEAHTMRYDGSQKWTPLHDAVDNSNAEIVKILLDAGAKVDALRTHRGQSEYGSAENTEETPLHMACNNKRGKNNYEIVKMLIEKGANVNAVRKFLENVHVDKPQSVTDPRDDGYESNIDLFPIQETPVHIAVKKKSADIVRLLVNSGADLTKIYRRGKEEKTVWELCGDEATRQALYQTWTPEKHHTFPKVVRDAIYTTLLIAKRLSWPLDKPILHRIFGFIAYGWIPERPPPQPEEKKKVVANLFDDVPEYNLFPDPLDALFEAQSAPPSSVPPPKKPAQSIFEEFPDVFENAAPQPKKSAKSIFDESDEDEDLFENAEVPQPKKSAKSIFDESDEDEDLFKNAEVPQPKKPVESIFDESDEDDENVTGDMFENAGTVQAPAPKKEANTKSSLFDDFDDDPLGKQPSSKKAEPQQKPATKSSLFDDDSLFG